MLGSGVVIPRSSFSRRSRCSRSWHRLRSRPGRCNTLRQVVSRTGQASLGVIDCGESKTLTQSMRHGLAARFLDADLGPRRGISRRRSTGARSCSVLHLPPYWPILITYRPLKWHTQARIETKRSHEERRVPRKGLTQVFPVAPFRVHETSSTAEGV